MARDAGRVRVRFVERAPQSWARVVKPKESRTNTLTVVVVTALVTHGMALMTVAMRWYSPHHTAWQPLTQYCTLAWQPCDSDLHTGPNR